MIAESNGLAPRTVASIQRRSTDDVPQLNAAIGRGGRIRLLNRIAGQQRRSECHSLEEVELPIDAVYTSRWLTMGVEKNDPDWISEFIPYQVNRAMLGRVGNERTIFLHLLPAVRGQEVTDDVLDGYESRAWRQASHKMSSAMAILEWCVLDRPGGDVH